MIINEYSFVIYSISIIILVLSIFIFTNNKNVTARLFSISIFTVSLWMIGVGTLISVKDSSVALIILRTNYFLGCLISQLFFFFLNSYPEYKTISRSKIILWATLQLIIFYIFVCTPLIVTNISPSETISGWIWFFDNSYCLFEVSFIGMFLIGIYRLIIKYLTYKDNIEYKRNILLMTLVIVIGFLPPALFCVLLPRFSYFDLNFFGPITQVFWIPVIIFSIIRYKYFEIKTTLTILLAFCILVAFFLNIFANMTDMFLVRILVLLVFILLSVYLVVLSIDDFKKREHLTTLNNTLSEKVIEQTSEIRKVYEIEQKARKDLEKLNETKDQFILLTQHNLRSPINSIRYELDELIKGRVGNIDSQARDFLVNSNKSVSRLSEIVDDFLNISTIKIDSQILKLTYGNIKTIINDVIHELRLDINRLNLNIQYISSNEIWPEIKMDMNKIREAIQIVVENAVKYNTYSGSVVIDNSIVDNQIKLKITNTGLGITKNEKNNLFNKLFYRSHRARKMNPIGMGIGLQVARAIINGHNGDLTIDSEGESLGAIVTISLPVDIGKVIERKFY